MQKFNLLFILASVAMCATPAMAQTELAQAMNCTNCHSVDKQLVGPTYKAIAAKYKGDKEAAERLAVKIVQGSSGVWGKYAMPASPQVNAEDAKKLAAWVLAQ